MKILCIGGKSSYSLIFVVASLGHFSQVRSSYLAAQGVSLRQWLFLFSGILAFVGGLSVALGYKAK